MKILIKRFLYEDRQTLGSLKVVDEHNKIIFDCVTLELPDLNNQKKISCIPAGKYEVKKRKSQKFGEHFHLLSVPNRSYILIHSGNFHTQILGCLLVGDRHVDLNGDKYKDVTSSKATMKKLLDILPEQFELTIS
jgi:hypothetical protein